MRQPPPPPPLPPATKKRQPKRTLNVEICPAQTHQKTSIAKESRNIAGPRVVYVCRVLLKMCVRARRKREEFCQNRCAEEYMSPKTTKLNPDHPMKGKRPLVLPSQPQTEWHPPYKKRAQSDAPGRTTSRSIRSLNLHYSQRISQTKLSSTTR